MQEFNYHSHTYRCKHADYDLSDEDYVKLYIEQGFKKIAFTDHCPYINNIDPRKRMRMDYSSKEEYYNSVRQLKEKYKDIIDIELGFEVEYAPVLEEYLLSLKSEVDKIVLGQHFICVKDEIKVFRYDDFTSEDLLNYATCIETAIKKGIPDIIVHPDWYMLSRYEFEDGASEAAHIICKASKEYGVPLEINLTEIVLYLTNQLNRISYPCKEFWKVAASYGVKVVYGVDAHFRNQIELYKESVEFVNKMLGEEILSKLHFCDEELK